jgi:EmrB/QacA subfamily drug resistance transporter
MLPLHQPTPSSAGRAWRGLALLVAGAFFMEMLDGTVIATAAPNMAASFGVRSVDINITITIYLLTLAVFIPVSGWVADRFGSRTVFASAIAVFTIASASCAISGSLGVLTVMRVLQGIGGAMMVPVGRLVVLRATSKAELIHAIAYLTWPALVAPIVAPLVGGVLSTYASWRWIFLLNVPPGLIALLLARRLVPNTKLEARRTLDWQGFALLGGGLAVSLYSVELISTAETEWLAVGAGLVAGGLLLSLAVRHLSRRPEPLVNLTILRVPTFRITVYGGSFFRVAVSAVPFLLPLMFQDAFGWTALKSGLLIMAVFVGNFAIKPLTTPILRRLGFRTVLLVTGVAAGVVAAACGLLTAGTPLAVVAAVLFLSGVLRSVGFTAYNAIAFADVEAERMSDANTLSATIQQLTTGFGVAIGALALRLGLPVSTALGLSITATSAFNVAFLLLGAIAWISVIESVRLAPHSGTGVSAATHRRNHGNASQVPEHVSRGLGATDWMSTEGNSMRWRLRLMRLRVHLHGSLVTLRRNTRDDSANCRHDGSPPLCVSCVTAYIRMP